MRSLKRTTNKQKLNRRRKCSFCKKPLRVTSRFERYCRTCKDKSEWIEATEMEASSERKVG